MYHPLWGMATSVKVVCTLHTILHIASSCFIRMTLSGMDRTAELAQIAVSSTLHRGLLKIYHASSTSDDIELRLCYISPNTSEDIPLELIELYVQ